MTNELKVAIEAAKIGAKQALSFFSKNPKITIKPDDTPVTEADKKTEEVIRQTILKKFPTAKFLGEEGGGENTSQMWVIDPIDGTKNFIRSLPFWGIQIGFVKDNKPVVGVSFGPSLNELMYAEKGSGAYLNGKKVHVSKVRAIEDAFLNHGTLDYFGEKTGNLLSLMYKTFGHRGYGDFYGYHLVAQGKTDIMLDGKNEPWDVAAIKVIVEEAGGKVTSWSGQDWTLNEPTTIATNGLIHDEVVRILNEKN